MHLPWYLGKLFNALTMVSRPAHIKCALTIASGPTAVECLLDTTDFSLAATKKLANW